MTTLSGSYRLDSVAALNVAGITLAGGNGGSGAWSGLKDIADGELR
jgi:hypothetical protein